MIRTTSHQQQLSQGTNFFWSSVKWSSPENDSFLSDFVERNDLPNLALITKGQFLSIGVPNLASPNLRPYVFVYGKKTIKKIIGRVLKWKDGRSCGPTDQKVAIPDQFSGYFEILSEDGRPMKCIESIQELIQKFPDVCIVRQCCRVYLPDGDGELRSMYRTRTLREGEILTLVGQFHLKKMTFLRCFDESGKSVYIKTDNPKGRFSPVAKKDAISGAHNVQNLLNKRLPLTVRLISGRIDSMCNEFPNFPIGQLVIRLQNVISEDHVIFCSLNKSGDNQLLSVPLNAHLKLSPVVNRAQILKHPEFIELTEFCQQILPSFYGHISPFNDQYLDNVKNNQYSEAIENGKELNGSNENSVTDDEIDQIYDYIRGIGPLPRQQPVASPDPKKPRQRSRSNTLPENEQQQEMNLATEMAHLQQRRASSPAVKKFSETRVSNNNLKSSSPGIKSAEKGVYHENGVYLDSYENRVKKPVYNKRLSKSNDKLADYDERKTAKFNNVGPKPTGHVRHHYQKNHNMAQVQPSNHRSRPVSTMYGENVPFLAPPNYALPHAPSMGVALNCIGQSNHVNNHHISGPGALSQQVPAPGAHFLRLNQSRAYKSLNNLAVCCDEEDFCERLATKNDSARKCGAPNFGLPNLYYNRAQQSGLTTNYGSRFAYYPPADYQF